MRLPAKASIQEQALTFMLLEPAAALDDESLTRRALLLAAAYWLHCMRRRGPAPLGTPEEVPRALEQAVKMAARGQSRATASLDRRWVASTPRGVRRLASWQPAGPARPASRRRAFLHA